MPIPPPPGQTAPNFNCGTGFQPVNRATVDSVEGVDITGGAGVPGRETSADRGQDARATLAETHYLADAVVTLAYKLTLFALTGRVNNSAFKGFAVGECLFLGAAGAKRGSGDWEIGYRFASSPNVTGLTVGDITGINKKDSQYLRVRQPISDSGQRRTFRPSLRFAGSGRTSMFVGTRILAGSRLRKSSNPMSRRSSERRRCAWSFKTTDKSDCTPSNALS